MMRWLVVFKFLDLRGEGKSYYYIGMDGAWVPHRSAARTWTSLHEAEEIAKKVGATVEKY